MSQTELSQLKDSIRVVLGYKKISGCVRPSLSLSCQLSVSVTSNIDISRSIHLCSIASSSKLDAELTCTACQVPEGATVEQLVMLQWHCYLPELPPEPPTIV